MGNLVMKTASGGAVILSPTNTAVDTTITIPAVTGSFVTADDSGNVGVAGSFTITTPAGLGYGTGAGGTVTQATSTTTAVTLNKPTGKITTFAGSIAANSSARFQVNNSLLASTDNVILTLNNVNGVGSVWLVTVDGTGAGLFVINIKNTNTTTAYSGPLIINFAIIKGATA